MHPAVVDQTSVFDARIVDPGQFAPTLSCPPEEDRTRQEFKDEADIQWLLRKYGALPPVRQFPLGEVDFDVDLMTARTSLDLAKEGYSRMPDALRAQMSFDDFLAAVASGTPVTAVPEVSSGADGSAPTEGRQS